MTCERTISVVVAVYNGERFIADALESILRQTRAPFEVCVVDDGSQDKTIDIVRWFPSVTCIECKVNAGQAAALNVGVASTQGDHLAFLDADDVWLPDKLAWQCELLDTRPELDVVYGLMRERTTGVGEALAKRDGRVLPAHLPSAMLIKRAAFERVGDFDERWTLGSVVDWYARACEVGLSQSVLQRVVYERRIHGANLGLTRAEHRNNYLHVLKSSLDRRRHLAAQTGSGTSTSREGKDRTGPDSTPLPETHGKTPPGPLSKH